MLVPAPNIPSNLNQKLKSASSRFMQRYEEMTISEVGKMLSKRNFHMPVLCNLSYHKNRTLKEVGIVSNLKSRKCHPNQFATTLKFLSNAVSAAHELWKPCIALIVRNEAEKYHDAGLLNPSRVSDEELKQLLKALSRLTSYHHPGIDDASALLLRTLAEWEQETRKTESAHESIVRAAQPVPADILRALEDERNEALRLAEAQSARGNRPLLSFLYDRLPEDDRLILEYRKIKYDQTAK